MLFLFFVPFNLFALLSFLGESYLNSVYTSYGQKGLPCGGLMR